MRQRIPLYARKHYGPDQHIWNNSRVPTRAGETGCTATN